MDASCLFYKGSRFVTLIDYQSPVTNVTLESAMHSGDQIDESRKSGEHNIVLNVKQIPDCIDTMWLVLSAYTNNLAAIRTPFIRLVEQATNTELCSYSLERAGTSQAVVMARIVRQQQGWKVLPVGVTSAGTVRNYDAFKATIANVERTGRTEE